MKARLAILPNDRDWRIGEPTAPVTVIEYGDFQCEDCTAAFPELKQVYIGTEEAIQFIFRHYPHLDEHEYALLAAQAAEAAGAQDKFWEMYEILYENSPDLTRSDLMEYADTIGLDLGPFEVALDSERYLEDVLEDLRGAQMGGIGKTPTIFINGELYTDEIESEALLLTIQSEIDSLLT